MFRALLLERTRDAAVALVRDLDDGALSPGEMAVAVGDSTFELQGQALSLDDRRGAGADLPALGAAIRKGEVQGRVVMDVNG